MVILSGVNEAEGSRCVTLKVSGRGPSVRAGLAFSPGMTEMESEKAESNFLDSALQKITPQMPFRRISRPFR
jgi:hypothetical protein